MRRTLFRATGPLALACSLLSCSEGGLLDPRSGPLLSEGAAARTEPVISQVYGGGGNSGATLKNDFIELFNPGAEPVSLAGWSVQYTSAAGTGTWAVTPLSGTIEPGGYYLVQEAAGAGGTADLPAPDAVGSIPMGATAGKVWLVRNTTPLTGACPAGAHVVDQVAFGTTASNCAGFGTTATLSNTTAAHRRDAGCAYTANLTADFTVAAPAPRNRATPRITCVNTPPEPTGPTTVVISELMGDPLAALSASWGEWFEVHNYGTEPVNLEGWTIRSGGQGPHVIGDPVLVPAGGYAVLSRSDSVPNNGGVEVDYNYFTGNSSTIWLDSSDWLALSAPGAGTVDSVRWSSLPTGATRAVRDLAAENADVDGDNWGFSTTPYGGGDLGTPGAANGALSDAAPPVPTGVVRITFSGRDRTDPALPVGFQDQLFATGYDAAGEAIQREGFVWSSDTPALATVDQDGVVTARGAGTAVIRATSSTGRSNSYALPTRVAVASATAAYEGNAEFGEPADGNPADDFVIRRAQFTSSYSSLRGTPNWVSYNLEATHFGAEDRCDCFTRDPLLPAAFPDYTTADYTGAGTYHGFGIDRGHLARSADRTAGSLDNAVTYYFSNIIPQAADNNQGPWAVVEDSLAKLARTGTREVYVVAGVAGNAGTVKDEGRIVIPESVWKVAIVLPRNRGVEYVDAAEDLELWVVDMPNRAGIRNTPWTEFRTTVDALEAKTGYDLVALLPDHVEWLVEAGIASPGGAPAGRLAAVLADAVSELDRRGTLADGTATSLEAMLSAARARISDGDEEAARGQILAFENEVRALVRSGRLTAEQGESLITFAGWVADAI